MFASSFAVYPVTVAATRLVGARLRRMTLTGPDLATHVLSGPDEYFGLVMPGLGQACTPLPGAQNLRAAVAAVPTELRPALRWYTVRRHRPELAEIDVDIVDHGDTGPGSHWMRRVSPGQEAGLWPGKALWEPVAGEQLLVADPSALPAARAIVDSLAPSECARTSLIAVVDDEREVEGDVARHFGQMLAQVEVTTSAEMPGVLDRWSRTPAAIWACGEGDLVKKVRSWGVAAHSVSTSALTWSPFWFVGRARP